TGAIDYADFSRPDAATYAVLLRGTRCRSRTSSADGPSPSRRVYLRKDTRRRSFLWGSLAAPEGVRQGSSEPIGPVDLNVPSDPSHQDQARELAAAADRFGRAAQQVPREPLETRGPRPERAP